MPDRDVLQGLLERVRAATGPDQELDADLMLGLGLLTRENRMAPWPDEAPVWEYQDSMKHLIGDHSTMVLRVTASIDAAVALVERVLSGASWSLSGPASHHGRNRAAVTASSPLRPMPVMEKGCATPGLNLIAAALTALIAAEDRPHDR